MEARLGLAEGVLALGLEGVDQRRQGGVTVAARAADRVDEQERGVVLRPAVRVAGEAVELVADRLRDHEA